MVPTSGGGSTSGSACGNPSAIVGAVRARSPTNRTGVEPVAGWHGVEMRHLTALEAVAAERSFSAAAARLGYTQSAISGQILALERVVGARVFERVRGARPLRLTDAGRVLLEHAAAINARLDAAQAELIALAAGGNRPVRVGILPAVSRSIVPAALGALARGGAPVQVELRQVA